MVGKIVSSLLRILVAIALVLTVWLVLANLTNMRQELLAIPLVLLGIVSAVILIPKTIFLKVVKTFRKKPNTILVLAVVLIIISIGLRFSFLTHDYSPTSDPEHFYNAAKDLVESGSLRKADTFYVASYPYLYSYDVLLAKSMAMFGQGLLAVIMLNTLLDVLAAGLLYLLIRLISGNKAAALLGATLWMVSPFNIIFSALSLPIIAVNTFIIASLLLVYLMLLHINNIKYLIPLSLATGALFSLSNSLRPFMVVFIIGLIIYWFIHFLKQPKFKKLLNINAAIIGVLLSFFILNGVYSQVVSDQTGLPPTASSGGWSVYVGSNYGESGMWNQEDSTYGAQVFSEEASTTEAHRRLQKEGIERYASLSPSELVDFGIKKSMVLGGDLQNSIYNLDTYPSLWSNEELKLFVWVICAVYAYVLLLLTVWFLVVEFRVKIHQPGFIHYLLMVFVGLFMALLLVEVANRYFMPFFVFLTIFASLGSVLVAKTKFAA